MSDTQNDPEVETRVRPATNDDAPDPPRHRRAFAVAAALVLVVGVVVAVVAGRDTALAPTGTESSLPAPDGTPNADGDIEIDPGRLRFPEPLPDDVVAFVDDPSLPIPRVEDPRDAGGGQMALPIDDPPDSNPPDSVSVVAMDGAELLMRGNIIDVAPDEATVDGPTIDVGVDGARSVDENRGAIVLPLENGKLRIVGPDDFFSFGGGGPHIDGDALLAIARAIGTTPIDEVDALPGFYVFGGSIGGRAINPIGVGTGVTVRHGGDGAMSATITRLPEPPTALDLLAIANARTRGSIGATTIGDVTLFDDDQFYIELVSPVDLLVVTNRSGVEDRIALAIDFAAIDELDEAFDGTVRAPPPGADPAPPDTAQSVTPDD